MSNDFERNFAVMIGINDYKDDIGILKTAVPDARKFARIIENQHNNLKEKYQSKNKYQVKLYVDKEANKYELEKLITDFTNGQIPFVNEKNEKVTVTKDDRVLFYFAGHGKALDALEHKDGPVGYLFPQDAAVDNEGKLDKNTCVKMQDLHDALIKLPCRHLLVILDCCFAGAFRWASLQREAKAKVTVYKERYDRFISDAAWQVITSASDDQTALDSWGKRDGNEDHSPFAQALFDALGGENADLNKDGIITATELYSYLRDRVEDSPDYKRQTPGLCQLKKHDKGEFIFLSAEFDRDKLADAPPLNPENNPYKGLESYDEKDSDLFFGRTEQIEKLYQKVVNSKKGLTLVLGASGTGKSSLVKAGLIPKLGDNTWHILPPFRPGEFPFTSLNTALKSRNQPLIATSEQATSANLLTTAAASLANWFNNNPQAKLMVVIDQFEELITLCKREEGEQFQELIKHALDRYRDKIHVVITLRLDFEAKFKTSVLKEFWHDNAKLVVQPMTQAELREVIEKPALEKVLYFDPPSLVDELINEVVNNMPGALPLLSFVLSELYLKYLGDRTRNNRALTEIDYQLLGGVRGAITNSADRKYEELVAKNSAYKNTVRQVMSRMVSLQGGALARRQVPRSELVYANDEENDRVETVINCFSEARLIVEGSNAQGEPYVEPAHDILVQNWTHLMDWVKEDEGKIILQRRLAQSAEEWSKKIPTNKSQLLDLQTNDDENIIDRLDRVLYGPEDLFRKVNDWRIRHSKSRQNRQKESPDNPKFFLWDSNPYLDDVSNRQRQSDRNWLNELENKFVEKSVLQKRRKNSWWWRGLFTVVAGLIGFSIIASIGQRNAQIALTRALITSSDARFAEGKQFDALLDGLRAIKQLHETLGGQDPQMRAQIAQVLQQAVYGVRESNRLEGNGDSLDWGVDGQIGWSPDGHTLAFASGDKSVKLWRQDGTKPTILKGYSAKVVGVSWSPNGQILATASADGTVKLWKPNGDLLITFQVTAAKPYGINWSPDGELLAIPCLDATVQLWKPDGTSLPPLKSHNRQGIFSVSWNPDGQTLASGGADRNVQLWKRDGTLLNTSKDYGAWIDGVSWSPDGKILAVSSNGKTDLLEPNGTFSKPLEHNSGVWNPSWNPSWSPDEQTLATAGNKDTINLWKQDGTLIELLKTDRPWNKIAWSPDGKTLTTIAVNGTVRLLKKNPLLIALNNHSQGVNDASFSPDGQILATASEDKTVNLLKPDGTLFATLKGHNSGVKSVSWSPDGQILTSADFDTVKLWARNGTLLNTLNGHSNQVYSVSWSPDGQTLASAAGDGTVKLWQRDGKPLKSVTNSGDWVYGLSWSPDGQILATADKNGSVFLRKGDGTLIKKLDNAQSNAAVSWSPDGQTLATNGDNTLILWNRDGTLLKRIQTRDLSGRIAWSLDGQTLATSAQNTIKLWKLNGTLLTTLKGHTEEVKSVTWSPDGQTLVSASADNTVKLWRLDEHLDNRLLDDLQVRGCDWVRDYLQNNPNVSDSDRALCVGITP